MHWLARSDRWARTAMWSRPYRYIRDVWQDLTVAVRKLFGAMIAVGVLALGLGIVLDSIGGAWGDLSFTVNIASSVTAALFGIPLALTILSRVSRKQAEQLRDREVLDLARNSFDLLSRSVLSLTERGNLVGPGLEEISVAELDALAAIQKLRAEIVDSALPALHAYYCKADGNAEGADGLPRILRIVSNDYHSSYDDNLSVDEASGVAQRAVIRTANHWCQVIAFEDNDVFWRIVQYYWHILETDVRPRLLGSNQYWASPILASAMPYLTSYPRVVLSDSGPYWPVLLFPLGYQEEPVAEPFRHFHPLGWTRPTMDDVIPLLATESERVAAVHDTLANAIEYLDRLHVLLISVRNMRSECIGNGSESIPLPHVVKEVSRNILV